MSIVASGSGSVNLSCYPITPASGDSITVSAYFSCPCYNDGDTEETVNCSWQIDGDASNYGSFSSTLRPGENFNLGEKTASATFSAPYSASATVTVSWNGSTLISASGYLQVG
jgi:hypothetical protein